MHPTAVKNRLNALQRARALLVQASDALESARAFKVANAVNFNIEVLDWEINYFLGEHGPIVEKKK